MANFENQFYKPLGIVTSPGYPNDPPTMHECDWSITCENGDKTLHIKTDAAYEHKYNCVEEEGCEDKWSEKKCKKKCNKGYGGYNQCKKNKNCKKNCKNTCNKCSK